MPARLAVFFSDQGNPFNTAYLSALRQEASGFLP
jgi:hypothetical protein